MSENQPEKCALCGNTTMRKHGTRLTRKGTFQLWQCVKCAHTQKGELVKEAEV